jgi:7-keto-8-aminopelargonate synthetase-like enzyme
MLVPGHARCCGWREVLNLCANNYLGLSSHPQVVEAAHGAAHRMASA